MLGLAQIAKDWNEEMYLDIVTIDADQECPMSHPADFIYDIWPGTRHACDCLERFNNPLSYPDRMCSCNKERCYDKRHDKKPMWRYDGRFAYKNCFEVPAVAPILQNIIKGTKFCASQADSFSYASYDSNRVIPLN